MLDGLGFFSKPPQAFLEGSEHFPLQPFSFKVKIIQQPFTCRSSMDFSAALGPSPATPPGHCCDFSAFHPLVPESEYCSWQVWALFLTLILHGSPVPMRRHHPGWQSHSVLCDLITSVQPSSHSCPTCELSPSLLLCRF